MDSLRVKVLISGLLAAAALLVAATLDTPGLSVGAITAVLQLLFAYSWPTLTRSAQPWPLRIILALAGLLATFFAVGMLGPVGMGASMLVIAVGVPLVFMSQVFRGTVASGRLSNTVSGISGLAVVSQGAGLSALGASPSGFGIILVSVIALLGAGACAMTRLPDRDVIFLAPLTGAALGAASSALPLGLAWYHCLLIGALAGVLVGCLRAITLASRAVKRVEDMLAVSTLILLLTGSLSWYAMQVLGQV